MRPGTTITHKKAGNKSALTRMIFFGRMIIAGAQFSIFRNWE
jgi:hypothetical protein